MARISIGVFETGLVPDELASHYPDYATMIEQWLRPAMDTAMAGRDDELVFVPISPVRGEAIPDPDRYDGYIYSGSKYGVYDKEPWIAELMTFVRGAADHRRPQLGICFGHQLMAHALGGYAEKSDRGWGCGIQTYSLDQSSYNVLLMHQDQVTKAPADADVVGGNTFCPLGALRYRSIPAISVQFHPEFSSDYVADLLEIRGGTLIDQPISDAAKTSLTTQPDNAEIAQWSAAFLTDEM